MPSDLTSLTLVNQLKEPARPVKCDRVSLWVSSFTQLIGLWASKAFEAIVSKEKQKKILSVHVVNKARVCRQTFLCALQKVKLTFKTHKHSAN